MMWLTPLVILPERTRLITMAVVALLTAVLPTAAILALKSLGRISDNAISSRNERLIPFALALAFRHLLLLQPMIVITVSIMLCGIVSSSRLVLHRHTFAQVGAGFALGLLCVVTVMLF